MKQKWLLDPQFVQIFMIPDLELAERQTSDAAEALKLRRKLNLTLETELGEQGLLKLQKQAEECVQNNAINLPSKLLESMPTIPKADLIPRLSYQVDISQITTNDKPLKAIHVLMTESNFAHIRIGLTTSNVDNSSII